MKYTEDMSFEEASLALLTELKEGLATLHEHFDGHAADWSKLHLPLAKVVSTPAPSLSAPIGGLTLVTDN